MSAIVNHSGASGSASAGGEAPSAVGGALAGGVEAANQVVAQDRFIATWGQMGATWGISRTMAEVHALLFITAKPLCADEVMERLAISRGNASMSLRSLVDWGLVTRAHRRGDRKEYFQAEGDVWALLQAVVQQRMAREVLPVLQALHEIRDLTGVRSEQPSADVAVAGHNARLDDMIGLVTLMEQLGGKLADLNKEQLRDVAATLARG